LHARSSPKIVAESKRVIDLDREMVVEATGAVYVCGNAISFLSRTGRTSTLVQWHVDEVVISITSKQR
jgi:hypothetical protein